MWVGLSLLDIPMLDHVAKPITGYGSPDPVNTCILWYAVNLRTTYISNILLKLIVPSIVISITVLADPNLYKSESQAVLH